MQATSEIQAAGQLIVKTAQANDQFVKGAAAEARQKTIQAARQESAKVMQQSQERASQGAGRVAQKNKQAVEAAFRVSIQGREPTPEPNFNGMSQALRTYVQVQKMTGK